MCPGNRLSLTCIVNDNRAYWQPDNSTIQYRLLNDKTVVYGSFSVYTINNSTTVVATATIESVPLSLNGVTVGCVGSSGPVSLYTINIAGYIYYYISLRHNIHIGPPVSVSNIIVSTINNSSVISWIYEEHCIINYTILVTSNNTANVSYTTYTTNITIPDLTIGSTYSFIIIPIDTVGREGPPSSPIQYIWNGMNYTVYILIVFLIVPVQVVNVSWYQISYDSIIIWWNNTEVRLNYYN